MIKWNRQEYDKNRYLQRKALPGYKEYRAKISLKNRHKNLLKWKAREALRYALRTGKVTKTNICTDCTNSPTECHHPDYLKPLQFIELCKSCHEKIHHNPKSHHE